MRARPPIVTLPSHWARFVALSLLTVTGASSAKTADDEGGSAAGKIAGETRSYVVTYHYNSIINRPAAEECPEGFATAPDPKKYLPNIDPAELKAMMADPAGQRKIADLVDHRAPGGRNICRNPWTEPDARMPVSQSKMGWGLDLDGGKRQPGCGHADLTSPDGLTGVDNQLSRVYACMEARRQTGYQPVFEDWLFHSILPFLAYGSLLGAAATLARYPETSLFVIAGASLLLLFIGIHNSWDTVTYLTLERARRRTETRRGESTAHPAPR